MFKYILEIRNKFILLLITLLSSLLVCYFYKESLLFLVTYMHLNNENLYFIFTDVTELFSAYFKLIFFVSSQPAFWYLLYQTTTFLVPALYFQEFKLLKFLLVNSMLFWILTGLLSSYILVPFGWKFFLAFQTSEGFYFEAQLGQYLKFYIHIYYLCLLYSQLFSTFFFFLIDVKKNYAYVKKYRKFYYYIFLLFSTFVTPPDLVSQVLSTSFIIFSYEITVLLLMFSIFRSSA